MDTRKRESTDAPRARSVCARTIVWAGPTGNALLRFLYGWAAVLLVLQMGYFWHQGRPAYAVQGFLLGIESISLWVLFSRWGRGADSKPAAWSPVRRLRPQRRFVVYALLTAAAAALSLPKVVPLAPLLFWVTETIRYSHAALVDYQPTLHADGNGVVTLLCDHARDTAVGQ